MSAKDKLPPELRRALANCRRDLPRVVKRILREGAAEIPAGRTPKISARPRWVPQNPIKIGAAGGGAAGEAVGAAAHQGEKRKPPA